ncbi:hypothetical protein K3495_g7853 [Podosphaera aphanis]|nr:hypothetical protein K3495_g7853 [Podosphaera aphanis]
MATTETTSALDHTERHGRRRPFSSWMRKLANFKSGSLAVTDSSHTTIPKRNINQIKQNPKKSAISKSSPHPEHQNLSVNPATNQAIQSLSTVPTVSLCRSSLERRNSDRTSEDGLPPPTIGNKSTAAASTGRTNSIAAPSYAPSSTQSTNCTSGPGAQGDDSTFSSPAPSVRSLTTTLTTLQSAAPATSNSNHINANTATVQFSHQFPLSSTLNAIPAHLASQCSGGSPATYNTATANNLLTDNASILTLASSSKRRRKRSIDTDASVRALAPSSLFGGSRESLPLSVLSANIESNSHQPRPSIGGLNERGSMYSVAGATPALASERNSFYASKQSMATDAGSIKSSPLGHCRNESLSGSGVGVTQGSSLASPREPGIFCPGKLSYSEITPQEDSKGTVNEEIKSQTP